MRPQPIQQNPISFLRKWPRAKRQLRGPSEYVEIVRVKVTQAELLELPRPEPSMFYRAGVPSQIAEVLAKEVIRRCKKGWVVQTLDKKFEGHADGTYYAWAKVRFYRP